MAARPTKRLASTRRSKRRAARVEMTQQYIVGELSLWLGQLQATAPTQEAACEFARLRLEAETAPFTALPIIALRARDLMRGLCRDSLAEGDLRALNQQATMAGELREFAVSAGLLVED
jgi:hypothetical protein